MLENSEKRENGRTLKGKTVNIVCLGSSLCPCGTPFEAAPTSPPSSIVFSIVFQQRNLIGLPKHASKSQPQTECLLFSVPSGSSHDESTRSRDPNSLGTNVKTSTIPPLKASSIESKLVMRLQKPLCARIPNCTAPMSSLTMVMLLLSQIIQSHGHLCKYARP